MTSLSVADLALVKTNFNYYILYFVKLQLRKRFWEMEVRGFSCGVGSWSYGSFLVNRYNDVGNFNQLSSSTGLRLLQIKFDIFSFILVERWNR